LVQVGRPLSGADGFPYLSVSEPRFLFLRDNSQSFEAVTAASEMGANVLLSDESQADYISGVLVTADFFRVLGIPPAHGRGFTAEEDSPTGERVAILGDGLWRRRFEADPGMIGRTLTLNGVSRTVVGIMPPAFEYMGSQDVFLPARINPASQNDGHNWTAIGRLKQGVTLDQAHSELKSLFDRFRAAHPKLARENETFDVMSWLASRTLSIRELLWVLLGAVGFVLLIACANVANLQLTRAAARQKEMAIRMALGAGEGRLIRMLLTESLLLALLGGAAGLLLAVWWLDALLALVPAGMLPRAGEIDLDVRVLAFALGASVLTGIISGFAPALQTSRLDVNRDLKDGKTMGAGARGRLRGALVVVEVALALALTVGAGLLLRTFANLRGVEPGFEARNVLTCEIAARSKNYDTVAKMNDLYLRALERFRSLPGVEAAALTNKLPLDGRFNLTYRLAGQSQIAGSVEYRLISRDYFGVMKIALQRGRPFDESDTAGAEPVAIINDGFARRNFPGVEPLAQRLDVCCDKNGNWAMHRVVGVVKETKQRNLIEPAPVTLFLPLAQANEQLRETLRQPTFVLRTAGDPSMLNAAIRSEMRQLDPSVPIRNLRPMEHLMSRSIAPQRFNLSLLSLFAGLGLLLAAVGIYGVMAYSVSQRTHEIGLRMALGAQRSDVVRLVVRQGMALALVGVVTGLIASLALTRLMKNLLFGVSATDIPTFIAIALLLLMVALLACYVPARRATKVDPMIALRCE
jgi:putative ABC transport system permease protein